MGSVAYNRWLCWWNLAGNCPGSEHGVLRVTLYLMIEPDYDRATVGHWCDTCSAPSVIETPILVITEDGVTRGGMHAACVDCGDDEGGDDD